MRPQRYTLEEWRAEATRLFGPVEQGNWSFQCPACGHIQSPASIKASGHGDPNEAYSRCFGRGTRADLAKKQGKKRGEKGDCDWKAWGLFRGPVLVIYGEKGEETPAFDFAPRMAPVGEVMDHDDALAGPERAPKPVPALAGPLL